MRVVVINSGNANACTGEQGDRDARRMAELTATACGIDHDQVLVLSTGIIGEPLEMEKVESGIRESAKNLSQDEASIIAAARGMMTTDKTHKIASRRIGTREGPITITGLAKGAGMIGPRMATMLSVIITDANLDPTSAQAILHDVVDSTFNCISVEGHTSTNDTVILLANGRIDGNGGRQPEFAEGAIGFVHGIGTVHSI